MDDDRQLKGIFRYSRQVRSALDDGRAVVALESTLIAHGLPAPHNLDTCRMVREAVQEEGAAPAIIAILDGQVRIGLEEWELERISDPRLLKASTSDLPFALSQNRSAATTVAATLHLAHQAGIPVLATGGIGGVHRAAHLTGDVSADLLELSRRPAIVVCSGAKSILDLPRTSEMLETLGIPVAGYRTREFPAFYSSKSGIALDFRIESPREAAQLYRTCRRLGIGSGLLVMNPLSPAYALEPAFLEDLIHRALQAARERGVSGKAVTPFLLARIQKATGGRAVKANQQLAQANARLAAAVAVELVGLKD